MSTAGEALWCLARSADSTDPTAIDREFFDYYRMPRGRHPRSTTAMSLTSAGPSRCSGPSSTRRISPRPVLFITGEPRTHGTSASMPTASEPKELHIVPGAGHVDLYDRVKLIPWDKLPSFFSEHLA